MHFIYFFLLGGGRLFEVGRLKSTFWGWVLIRGWALINFFYLQGGCLFEVGRLKSTFWGWVLIRGWALINFFYPQGGRLFEVGAYSRWVLIRDWALNRMNTVLKSTHQFNGKSLKKGIYIELSQLILLPKPIIVSGMVFPMLFYL